MSSSTIIGISVNNNVTSPAMPNHFCSPFLEIVGSSLQTYTQTMYQHTKKQMEDASFSAQPAIPAPSVDHRRGTEPSVDSNDSTPS